MICYVINVIYFQPSSITIIFSLSSASLSPYFSFSWRIFCVVSCLLLILRHVFVKSRASRIQAFCYRSNIVHYPQFSPNSNIQAEFCSILYINQCILNQTSAENSIFPTEFNKNSCFLSELFFSLNLYVYLGNKIPLRILFLHKNLVKILPSKQNCDTSYTSITASK